MSNQPFALRCPTCGGESLLELATARGHCAHCGASHAVDGVVVGRLRAHLTELEGLQRQYADAAEEHDRLERVRAAWHLPAIMRFVFPLLAGFWTMFSLGVGVGSMVALMPLLQKALGDQLGGFIGSTGGLALYAGLLASMRLLLVRHNRRRARIPQSNVVREVCPACGGAAPMLVGGSMRCPFCATTIVASEGDQQRIASEARGQLHAEQVLQEQAAQRAESSGAENAQRVLDMVSMATLLPIVFVAAPVELAMVISRLCKPVICAVVVCGRDTVDIVGMVLAVVFGAGFIAIAIVVSVRRARAKTRAQKAG